MTEWYQNVEIIQGVDLTVTIPVYDENGDAKTLTGATNIELRVNDNDGSALFTKSGSVVTVSVADDAVRFSIGAGDTSGVDPDIYDMSVALDDSGGNHVVVARGSFIIKPSIN